MPSTQFHNLAYDKQQQIVQASLTEFAEFGYDMASTNRIVEKAGISKGVLFKYFNGKEALFLYVCDETAQSYFDTLPRQPTGDLFDWLREATVRKMAYIAEHPETARLWIRIMKEPTHALHTKALKLQSRFMEQFSSSWLSALSNEELNSGLTWQHVFNIFAWIGLGLQEKYISIMPNVADEDWEPFFNKLVAELEVYLDVLKFGIYKEGRS